MTNNIEVLRGLVEAAEKVNALSILDQAHKELRVALRPARTALAAMGGEQVRALESAGQGEAQVPGVVSAYCCINGCKYMEQAEAKPELCGCGKPAEYMAKGGGWCCNKYGIKCRPQQPEARVGGEVQPVAWLYTLEYGGHVANTKVSKHQLSYPFGVCGSDYLARNDEGVSYVRQTPLYTTPPPSAVPDGWKLVPLKPTREMWDAWHSAPDIEDDEIACNRAYAAMLAAAPEPGEGV